MPESLNMKSPDNSFYPAYPGTVDNKIFEDSLRRRDARYYDLVESAKSIILEMDREGRVVFWNKFAGEFFGYPAEEIMGKPVVGTIVPEIESSGRDLKQLIEDICRQPDNYTNNINENIKKNGERVWIAWTNRPLTQDDGNFKGVLCIGNDITACKVMEERLRQVQDELELRVRVRTAELSGINEQLQLDILERKRLEDAARDGEAFLNSIFSSIQDGISILDCSMNIVRVNSTMERWYAYAMPLVGKKCYQAYHGQEDFCKVCPSLKTRDTGGSYREVIPKRDEQGKIIGWFDLYSFPLIDINSGQMKGVIEYVRDITDQKKAEDSLGKINECFLSFGSDANENISRITNLCGVLLEADCALYNRLEHGLLCSAGQWNTPDDFKQIDSPGGHICYDVIQSGKDKVLLVRNLQQSAYALTDPNVKRYNLQTYLGYPVRFKGECVGSLCVVYNRDIVPSEEDSKVIGILASAIGIEEERRVAELALKYRLEFEKLIMGISTDFINISLENIDSGIDNALRIIGQFIGVDRSYIFLLRGDGKKMDNVYEWCADGVESHMQRLQGININNFPWFMKRINSNEMVYIPKVSDLPIEATAEKNEFELEGISSLLCIPFIYVGRVIGFLGFDSLAKAKEWPEDSVSLLKVVGEILANTLGRKWANNRVEKLNKELISSNKALKQMSLRDPQTGLYNHRYLAEVIEAEFHRARRYAHPLSAIMLDVDYFKSINDVYGHEFGDLVLHQLARQFKKMVRQYDIVIRFGGEEFVIISPGSDLNSAITLSQRILDAIGLYNFGNKQHFVKIKLSIAVISYPEDSILKGMDLIEYGEKILNKVKESGGNRVYSSLDIGKKIVAPVRVRKENTDSKFLKEKIERLTKRANQNLVEAVFAFAKTIELKDRYTGEHVERTVHYATEIARVLKLSKEEVERIRQAAILHDLGKIGISEKILLKKSKLSKEEFIEIKKHPQIGVDIIRPIQFLHAIVPFVLYHHERWDGRGYPNGLKGEEIPLGARIIAIADVYQALISDRPYRKAYSKDKVKKIIKESAGTQFDPKIVSAFLEVV